MQRAKTINLLNQCHCGRRLEHLHGTRPCCGSCVCDGAESPCCGDSNRYPEGVGSTPRYMVEVNPKWAGRTGFHYVPYGTAPTPRVAFEVEEAVRRRGGRARTRLLREGEGR